MFEGTPFLPGFFDYQLIALATAMFNFPNPYRSISVSPVRTSSPYTASQQQAMTLAQSWSQASNTLPTNVSGLSLEQAQAMALVHARNNINIYCAPKLNPSATKFAHVTARPAGQYVLGPGSAYPQFGGQTAQTPAYHSPAHPIHHEVASCPPGYGRIANGTCAPTATAHNPFQPAQRRIS